MYYKAIFFGDKIVECTYICTYIHAYVHNNDMACWDETLVVLKIK